MTNKPMNILMLGTGPDQEIAIEEAHKLGLSVVGFDGNPEASGFYKCEHKEVVDIKNPEAVETAALAWNKKVGIDGVIAPAVEVGQSVGRVVDKLGLIGIGEVTADKLTDKILRRQALDELKIPQPEWAYREEKKMGLWSKYPCVVKPRNKSAAQGVRIAYNVREIGLDYDYVEEYLEGWEISAEILVGRDSSMMMVLADRNYDKKLKWKPYLLEDGCQLPSKLPAHLRRKIAITADKIIQGFHLRSCAIKLDLLIKDNIVYVLEIAPRLGGGKLSSVMIPMAYNNLNWWGLAIKTAMGIPFTQQDLEPLKLKPKCVAQRYRFPDNPTSHKDRLGSVERIGSTYEEAVKNAEEKING